MIFIGLSSVDFYDFEKMFELDDSRTELSQIVVSR